MSTTAVEIQSPRPDFATRRRATSGCSRPRRRLRRSAPSEVAPLDHLQLLAQDLGGLDLVRRDDAVNVEHHRQRAVELRDDALFDVGVLGGHDVADARAVAAAGLKLNGQERRRSSAARSPSMSLACCTSAWIETSVSAVGPVGRPPGTVALFWLIAWKISATVAPVPIKRPDQAGRGTRVSHRRTYRRSERSQRDGCRARCAARRDRRAPWEKACASSARA